MSNEDERHITAVYTVKVAQSELACLQQFETEALELLKKTVELLKVLASNQHQLADTFAFDAEQAAEIVEDFVEGGRSDQLLVEVERFLGV